MLTKIITKFPNKNVKRIARYLIWSFLLLITISVLFKQPYYKDKFLNYVISVSSIYNEHSCTKPANSSYDPQVSIILPTYNGMQYLPTAIDSILNQDFGNFELIIVDDGSTDNTWRYLKSLCDSRIVLIHQNSHRLSKALNNGFSKSRGRYLTWVSPDNVYHTDFAKVLRNALFEYREADVTYGNYEIMNAVGEITGMYVDSEQFSYEKLISVNTSIATFMYTRRCMEKIGLYDESLEGVENHDYWLRLKEKCGPSVYVPLLLMKYRKYASDMTSTMSLHNARRAMFENFIQRNNGHMDMNQLSDGFLFVHEKKSAARYMYHRMADFMTFVAFELSLNRMFDLAIDWYQKSFDNGEGDLNSALNAVLISRVLNGSTIEMQKLLENIEKKFGHNSDLKKEAVIKKIDEREGTLPHRLFPANVDNMDLIQKEKMVRNAYTCKHAQCIRKRRVLAVIPSDPLDEYVDKGLGNLLENSSNPNGFFDEVYVFSPWEQTESFRFGMHVMPIQPLELPLKLKEYSVDIIRAFGSYWACDMAVYNRAKGVKVVVSVHDPNPNFYFDSLLGADYVIPVSDLVANKTLQRGISPERLTTFTHSINMQIFKPQPEGERQNFRNKISTAKYQILHVGRKSVEKNGDTLIKSLKFLGPDYSLIMIGRGSEYAYKSLAESLGVESQVIMMQSINNEDLPKFYSYTDVFCVPSLWEGFGVVFIEALASGAAIVSSNISPINEIIQHDYSGYLVDDFQNAESLASALKHVVENKEYRAKIQGNARNSVSRFRKENIDLLESVIYRVILESDLPQAPNMSIPKETHSYERYPANPVNLLPIQPAYNCSFENAINSKVSMLRRCLGTIWALTPMNVGWEKAGNYTPNNNFGVELDWKVPISKFVDLETETSYPPLNSSELQNLKTISWCAKQFVSFDNDPSVKINRVYTTSGYYSLELQNDKKKVAMTIKKTSLSEIPIDCPDKPALLVNIQDYSIANSIPIVNIVLSNFNQGKAFLDFIEMFKMIQQCTGDKNFRIIVADYNSTDLDIDEVLRNSDLPYILLNVEGKFSRASGLQAGAMAIPNDDEIMFAMDTYILLPMDVLDRIRQTCQMGKSAYAPQVFRLKKNAPILLSEKTGFYETRGWGMIAFYKKDLIANNGGYDVKQYKEIRGGEDEDISRRFIWDHDIQMVRTQEIDYFHFWHGSFGNKDWEKNIGSWVYDEYVENTNQTQHFVYNNVADGFRIINKDKCKFLSMA